MHAGDVVAERFEIELMAGSGGMGAVYRARDKLTGERVALKTLFGQGATDVDRFTREAALLAELRHPSVVRYVTHGVTAAGMRYLVMEWLEGIDLATHLMRTAAPLAIDDALEVVRRVAEALSVPHGRGIVHRDIKPSNVFLIGGRIDGVRLLDFGIARQNAAGVSTKTGMVVGTPGYMAPEQARGDRDIDARADVFSLGCVLFECLSGRPAFVGEHIMALLAKILIEEVPRVAALRSGVPSAVDRLVSRMLAKERSGRPADATALIAELDALGPRTGAARPTIDVAPSIVPPSSALTTGEQRLLSIVTIGSQDQGELDVAAPTITPEQDAASRDSVRAAVSTFGGRFEQLANGSAVVTLMGRGSATDQAAQAAQCALAMRGALPGVAIALATGRGRIAERWPVGEVIERAVKLLRAAEKRGGAPEKGVHLDEVTAGLLDVRFEVSGDEGGLVLVGERDVGESARTLLGRETPCVGREVELRTLEAVFAECVDEPQARAVLVTAPAGVGKSRLRHEFLARLGRGGEPAQVWIARGDPMSAGSPFGLIARAVRRAAGVLDGEPHAVQARKLRARIARHVAAEDVARVTDFVGEMVGVPLPDDDNVQLRAAHQDPMLMGDQMLRAFEDLVLAECGAQPLVVVLEDLHWGDLPTVKFVDAALRNLADSPLLVLALARPEVHDQFPKLWAGRAVTQLSLGELSRKAGEKLVRHALGKNAAADLVSRVLERAAGNAFYLEELIRAVAEGKGERLPETVLAMVQARLEALDSEARRVLRAASLFGQVFWTKGVEALVSDRRADVPAWIEALVERELCTRHGDSKFPGQEELGFRHAMVREAAYAMLTDEDRAMGHMLAAGWLEGAGESDPMVLAEHFERGGAPERAIEQYARAAEQALEGNDLVAAIDRAQRGIACGAAGEVRAELRLMSARALQWKGEIARAESESLDALGEAASSGRVWCEAAGLAALATGKLGNVARLVEIAERTLDACEHEPISAELVVAAARVAQRLLLAGRYELAETLIARTEAPASELGQAEPAVAVIMHHVRALRANFAGDTATYLSETEAAAMALERIGDHRNLCSTRANLGNACAEMGRWALAERTLRDAKAAAERLGLPGTVAHAAQNLGLVLSRRGRLDEARAIETAAVDAFAALGNRRMEGGSRAYLATIALAAGDQEAAEREARAAVKALDVAPPLLCYALAVLSRVLLVRGDVDGAVLESNRAMEILERLGQTDASDTLVRLSHAEAHHAAGDVEAARTSIRVARDRLWVRTAMIRDSEARRCFLEQIPENARTVELAAAWAPDQR